MALGLCRLRLAPDEFWRLALPELAAMAGGIGGARGMSRGDVEGLMRRFPD